MATPSECQNYIHQLADALQEITNVEQHQVTDDQIDVNQFEVHLRDFEIEFTRSWAKMMEISCEYLGPPIAVNDRVIHDVKLEYQSAGFTVKYPIMNPMVNLAVECRFNGEGRILSSYRIPTNSDADNPDCGPWQAFLKSDLPVNSSEIERARRKALKEIPSMTR